jgi:hypothetical protein
MALGLNYLLSKDYTQPSSGFKKLKASSPSQQGEKANA